MLNAAAARSISISAGPVIAVKRPGVNRIIGSTLRAACGKDRLDAQEVALQISAQSVTPADLLAHPDQLAGIVASIAAS
jgi:hypothetical protein